MTLGKGPMLPSIEVHSQRHFAVGLKRRERDLLVIETRPTVPAGNGKACGRDALVSMLLPKCKWDRSSCIRQVVLESCEAYQKQAENCAWQPEIGVF